MSEAADPALGRSASSVAGAGAAIQGSQPSSPVVRPILADLHLHTVLSPCAEVEMIPPLIVRRALALGVSLIAVTDHNAAGNCAAVMRSAEGTGLAVLPGMEVQTSEEIHILCLFDTLEQVLTWQGTVFDHLPDRPNPEDVLGAQFVVDADGEYLRTETRLLLTSTDLSLDEVVQRVRTLGGLPIPAHIDRPSFSLLANLGFVPPALDVPALELFRFTEPAVAIGRQPSLARWPLIRNSDAHQLSDIAPRLRFTLAAPTVGELALALAGQDGRAFSLVS
jgi:PHP family Zn ribbon phosphoesterase